MKTHNDWIKIWRRGNCLFDALQDDISEITLDEEDIKQVGKYKKAYYDFMNASNQLHDWIKKMQ